MSIACARWWMERGFHPIPVLYRTKKPELKGWPSLRLAEADLATYFNDQQPHNIGIILGDEYGSADVDLDCTEAIAAAAVLLPSTNLIFGRSSKPASHYIYRVDPLIGSLKFLDPIIADDDEATIVELRCAKKNGGSGLHTVVPDSVHESGEAIRFEPGYDGHAANVDAEVLTAAVAHVAAAALLARRWPAPKAGRNDAFLALAGMLARAGWSVEQASAFAFTIYRLLWGAQANRSSCISEVGQTFEKYFAHAETTGIPKLKSLVDERAIRDALKWLKIDTRQSTTDGNAQTAKRLGRLPDIQTNNRELRDVTTDCLQALRAANHPPEIFVRAGAMVIVSVDEDQRRVVRDASDTYIRGALTRAANFHKVNLKEEFSAVPPPLSAVHDLMERPCAEWNLPAIAGITEAPLLRPDGTILSKPGYDHATRMVYVPPADFRLPAIPDQPTESDLVQAIACIEDAIGEFPFLDEASRANAFAMLLSQVVRPVVKGNRPIALIDAPQAGPGKTLLAEVLALIYTGSSAALRPAPHGNDEEWRKAITAILMDSHQLTVFDNVEGVLLAPSLALAVTASTWSDRVLGLSKNVRLSQNTNFIVTGNNIILGGDLPRRCYWIRLDSPSSRPWQGREFRHPDLKGWVQQNRSKLLAALLTMARAWFVRGRPKPKTPILGSFENWCGVVGGILEVANVPGFLGNLEDLYEQADPSQEQWTDFLAALHDRYQSFFTVEQIVREAGTDLDLRRLIPDGLYHDKRMAQKLGWAFRKRLDRRYGKENFRLIKGPGNSRVAKWRVMTDPEVKGGRE